MTTPAEGTQPSPQAPVAPPANPAPQAPAPAAPEPTPPAPAPEPVAPRIEEPAAGESDAIAYEPTGDTRLDVALDFIGKLGIGAEHQAVQAAMKGDFSFIRAALATMGDKATGWEQMVALAEQAYADAGEKAKQAAAASQAAVEAVVGGKDNWDAIKKWAAANATPDEKAALNAMFDAGTVQARAAAALLLDAYRKAPGNVINPANPTRNLAGQSAPADTGALSPRDYAAAVRQLHGKLGNRMEGSQEYAALRQRLAAYRG